MAGDVRAGSRLVTSRREWKGEGGVALLYNDPAHWRQRADEAREIARKMADLKGREAMLAIADKYDQLAQRAAERMSAGAALLRNDAASSSGSS